MKFTILILIASFLLVSLVMIVLVDCFRDGYSRIVRYNERSIDEACLLSFEARATQARALDADVGYHLQLAKRAVDRVRKSSPDQTGLELALARISDLLSSAAETSDRALQALEDCGTGMGAPNPGIFTKEKTRTCKESSSHRANSE